MVKSCAGTKGQSGTFLIDSTNSQDWYAGENLTDGQVVCLKPNDAFYDTFETYANTSAVQAVYVDSDGDNKMVSLEETNFCIGAKALKLLAVTGGASENDMAIRTVTSRDLTGYSVKMLARASATSGDWQFVISSTTGAASNYRYSALTFGGTDTYELITIAVADMTESGTCVETAITQVGIKCVASSGTPSLIIDRIWFEKAGTTKFAAYKADASDWSLLPAIGFVDATYSAGNTISDIITDGPLDGFTGLIPGADVYVSATAGGVVQYKASLPTLKQVVGTALSDDTIMVNIGRAA